MATDLAVIGFETDTTGLKRGEDALHRFDGNLNGTQRKVKTATGRMRQNFNNLASRIFSVRGAIVTLAGTGGIGLLVRKQMQAIDTTAKFARMIGETTEEVSRLQHAAEITAGVTDREFNMAFQRMTRRVAEAARDTGEAQQAIKDLGLEADRLAQIGPANAFRDISSAIQEVENPAQRVRIAFKLFDSEGAALVNTLNAGADEIDRLAQEADELGRSFNSIDAAQVEAANDAITRMQSAVGGVTRQLAIELAPVVSGVADRMTQMTAEGRLFGQTIGESVEDVTGAIGFVADSVEGVRRTFQVLGRSAAVAFLGIQEGALAAADYIINWPTRAANDLIELLNKIPGMDIEGSFGMSEWGENVHSQLQVVRGAVAAGMDDIHNILMQPMPSAGIEQFIADTRSEIERAVQDAGPIAMPGMGGGESGSGMAEQKRQQMEQRVQSLREGLATEMELERMHYQRKREFLQEAHEGAFETEQERKAMLRELEVQHQNRLVEIAEKSADKRSKVEQQAEKTIQSMRMQTFRLAAGLFQALAGESKEAAIASIAINKGLSMAEAYNNTAVAATRALAVGGPFAGPPLAAAMWAYGKTQMGLIAATGLAQASQVGGGGASAGSVSNPISTAPQSTATPAGQNQQEESEQRKVVEIRRSSRRRMWDDEEVGELIEVINEHAADGARIELINTGGRR